MPSPPRNSRRIRKIKNQKQKSRSPRTKNGSSKQSSSHRPLTALSRSLPLNTKRKSPRGRLNEFKNNQTKHSNRKSRGKSPFRHEGKAQKHKVVAIYTAGEKTAYVRQGAMSPK